MSLLSSRTKRRLGVDLSSQAIKFIELSKTGQTYRLENYAIYEFPQPIIMGGMIADSDAIVNMIRHLFKQNKFSVKTAVLAVPDACTLRKMIAVSPNLTADDLDELVSMEVDKLWPHATERLNFDFQWCQPTPTDLSLRDLFIIASRSDYIEQRVHIAKCAGLRVCAMDVESQALYRVFSLVSQANHQTMGWIHFEETSFDLYIFDKGMSVFTHREIFKRAPEVAPEHILIHIKRVLQIFQVSYPMYPAVEQVILSETTLAFSWASILSAGLGLQVVKTNPFQSLSFAKHLDRDTFMQHADALLIACGLALRV